MLRFVSLYSSSYSYSFLSFLKALATALLLFISCSQWCWADDNSAVAQYHRLHVVASIKPIALIARDVIGDLGEVEVLVSANSSPHDYSLKMSDAKKLAAADKVIWLGPDLEQFLVRAIKGLKEKQVLTLGEKLVLGDGEAEQHHDEVVDQHNNQHEEHRDLHVWLSPLLAKQIATLIAESLIVDLQLDHQEALIATLRLRLAKTLDAYDKLETALRTTLAPAKSVGFVVYHRAYDYFVDEFALRQLGYVSMHPEVPIGIKHLANLQALIAKEKAISPVKCLFVEQAHQSGISQRIATQFQLVLKEVDILGNSEDVSTYIKLMEGVGSTFSRCLLSNNSE